VQIRASVWIFALNGRNLIVAVLALTLIIETDLIAKWTLPITISPRYFRHTIADRDPMRL
jgi:hypothetical protein